MKEFDILKGDKVELTNLIPVKKEPQIIGTLKLLKGHKCFELNLLTNNICEAIYSNKDADFILGTNSSVIKRKLVVRDDCVYVTALNLKNASKHFNNKLKKII